ncbi:MAG: Veg family protein [Clostridia bacterium]|nr:Veg family protein [Clostridia bacterium]
MKRNNLSINQIKEKILELKGQEVKMFVNRGRRKVFKFDAVVEDVYGSVFTVKNLKQAFSLTHTYSYNDILCGDVKINTKQ